MNRWMTCLLIICLPAILLVTACQPRTRAFLPVTGVKEEASLPALVAMTRGNVLEYLLASARLETIPPVTDWELAESLEGEYHFRSGDWLMLIRSGAAEEAVQWVLIINQAENASWTGYVTADGDVVDTAYAR
jgi:hypothetical protein